MRTVSTGSRPCASKRAQVRTNVQRGAMGRLSARDQARTRVTLLLNAVPRMCVTETVRQRPFNIIWTRMSGA